MGKKIEEKKTRGAAAVEDGRARAERRPCRLRSKRALAKTAKKLKEERELWQPMGPGNLLKTTFSY